MNSLFNLKTFVCSGELTAISDDAGSSGLTGARANAFESIEHLEATSDLAEHAVLAIEPGGLDEGHEELGAVGVGAGIGHGEITTSSVPDVEVLVLELHAIDGLATGTVASGEITSLSHELSDNAMERGALVVEGLSTLSYSLLSSAEGTEVLSSLGGLVSVELHGDAAGILTTDGHVEENSRVGHI